MAVGIWTVRMLTKLNNGVKKKQSLIWTCLYFSFFTDILLSMVCIMFVWFA